MEKRLEQPNEVTHPSVNKQQEVMTTNAHAAIPEDLSAGLYREAEDAGIFAGEYVDWYMQYLQQLGTVPSPTFMVEPSIPAPSAPAPTALSSNLISYTSLLRETPPQGFLFQSQPGHHSASDTHVSQVGLGGFAAPSRPTTGSRLQNEFYHDVVLSGRPQTVLSSQPLSGHALSYVDPTAYGSFPHHPGSTISSQPQPIVSPRSQGGYPHQGYHPLSTPAQGIPPPHLGGNVFPPSRGNLPKQHQSQTRPSNRHPKLIAKAAPVPPGTARARPDISSKPRHSRTQRSRVASHSQRPPLRRLAPKPTTLPSTNGIQPLGRPQPPLAGANPNTGAGAAYPQGTYMFPDGLVSTQPGYTSAFARPATSHPIMPHGSTRGESAPSGPFAGGPDQVQPGLSFVNLSEQSHGHRRPPGTAE